MKRLLALLLFFAVPTFAVTISGTVLPVPGMTVQAYDDAGVLRATATTNAAGNYALSVVAGKYRVLAFDPNGIYATSFYPGAESFDTSSLLDAQANVSGIDFSLLRGGIIAGTVTSTAGMPLPSMTIAAYNADGTKRGFTTTDVNGRYQLVLPPGTYDVAAYDDALVYLVAVTRGSSVIADTTVTDDFQLTKTAVVNGVVSDAVTGAAIAGADVSAYANGLLVTTVTADANGRYRIVLAPGTYRVVAFDPAGVYAASFWPSAESFDTSALLTLGEGAAPAINPQLVRAARFAGHVADAVTNASLAGITVAAYNADGTMRAFTVTDGGGNYVLVVPQGAYRLAAYDANAVPTYLRAFAPVTESAFVAQTTTVSFAVPAGAIVTGTAANASLAPLSGISVGAYDATGLVAASTTNATGGYRLLLAGGAYTLAAFDNAFRYATGYESIAVTTGQSLPNQNFALVSGAHVSGTVVDASGSGLTAMTVAAYDANGNTISTAISGANGAFDLMLAPGTYRLAAFDPAHRFGTSASQDVSVVAGQITSRLRFALAVTSTSHHRAARH